MHQNNLHKRQQVRIFEAHFPFIQEERGRRKKKEDHQSVYEVVSETKSNIKKQPLAFDGKSLKIIQVPWNAFKAL